LVLAQAEVFSQKFHETFVGGAIDRSLFQVHDKRLIRLNLYQWPFLGPRLDMYCVAHKTNLD